MTCQTSCSDHSWSERTCYSLGSHHATDSWYSQQSLSRSRLRIMMCVEENMRASTSTIPICMSTGRLLDSVSDIYKLDL